MSWGILDAFNFGTKLFDTWTNQKFAESQQEDMQSFNAEQAQINRSWEERMSNTQYQRRVEDLKAAGLNPMLAYMTGPGSTPSGSAASSGTAGYAGSNIGSTAQSASQIAMNNALIDQVQADIEKKEAETKEIEARTPTYAVNIEATKQNIQQSIAQVQLLIAETNKAHHSAANIQQQTENLKETIPQIRATVEQLKALAKLHGAQTGLAGAQTTLTRAQTVTEAYRPGLVAAETGQAAAITAEIKQKIDVNLPKLEAALRELERQEKLLAIPGLEQNASVQDSYIGSLSAVMKALNPFVGIMPTVPIRGTGAAQPQETRKWPRK